jgi:hypothetical protein
LARSTGAPGVRAPKTTTTVPEPGRAGGPAPLAPRAASGTPSPFWSPTFAATVPMASPTAAPSIR